MSLSYKGENIPKMYEELIRLRAQLGEVESYLGGGKGNAVQAARMAVDELNEKRAQLERAQEALQPFAKDEFCVELGGNVQGGDSPVFERQRAMLKISDFRRAQDVWRELENGGGDE